MVALHVIEFLTEVFMWLNIMPVYFILLNLQVLRVQFY